MRSVIILLSTLAFLWVYSCKEKSSYLSPSEYLQQANDSLSPLVVTQSQSSFDFVCGYRPLDFFIARELVGESRRIDLESTIETYGNATYFILSVSSKQKDANYTLFGTDFKGEQSMDLLYGLKDYFSLVNAADTIAASMVTIDRSWGISDEVAILAVFPRIEDSIIHNYTLKMNDFGLKCGTVLFSLKSIKTDKLRLLR